MKARNIGERQVRRWIFRLYQQGLLKPIKPKNSEIKNENSVSKISMWELVYNGRT